MGAPSPPSADTPSPAELPLTARDPALDAPAHPRPLTMGLLASLAKAELVDMARAGELGTAKLWVAFKGARAYLEALARGDAAGEDEALRRLATCRQCPHRTARAVTLPTLAVDVWHCGEAFVESCNPDGSMRTCGCLVGVSVHGEQVDRPAGKPLVGSERCPQGRW